MGNDGFCDQCIDVKLAELELHVGQRARDLVAQRGGYKVWIAATDLPGNAQTSYAVGTSSNGFTYDTQFATSAVVVPVNADYYNASTKPLPVISGTAVDETLGNRVQSVGYSIKENVSGNYWNVLSSTFNSGSELFNAMSFSNPNVWTSTHPTLQDGLVYAVRTRATDLAGNVEPLKAPLTFTFDVSSPTARITQPSSGSQLSSLPYISGTVFDNTGLPGVQTVELAIQVDTGTWYSNVSGTFDQNSEYFFTAASTNNFTTWFATGIPFVDGHVYGIKARATDKATNVQMVFTTNISTLTFTFDNVPPVTVIQVPVGEPSVPRVNSLPIISGTAADTLNTSLNLVQLRIRRDDLLQYYDPASSRNNPSFSITETNSNTAWFTADTLNAYVNWSATFSWTDGSRYLVQSRAIDQAGKISAIVSSTFTYDTSAPTSFVSLPSSAVIAGLVLISGTASDGGTVTNLETAIENLNTGQWFDGSGFTGSGVLWQPKSTLTGAGPFTWTYTVLHNSALQTGTSYYVISRAYDDSGNIESNTAPGSETFTYDINVPTATLQVPANNLYYKAGQVTTLSGTAADTVSVVKTLQLYIQRNSDGQYWQDLESPADGFGVWGTTVSAINVSTSSLPNWSYTLGNEPEIWSHNAAYKVWIAATDLPGNAQTSYAVGTSSNGFTYDTQFATSAVVVPVNADYYNASTKPLPVISGTAVDETIGEPSSERWVFDQRECIG